MELLVGMFVGMLIIAAALATLTATRATSAQVSEVTQVQQQAAFALRTLGLQIRQAGSIDLQENETVGLYEFVSPQGSGPSVQGSDGANGGSDTLIVSHQVAQSIASAFSDCLGDGLSEGIASLTSTFKVDKKELRCKSSKSETQGARALIRNVEDFQVRYRVTDASGTRSMTADSIKGSPSLWQQVHAVEVCLELGGDATDNSTATGNFTDCHGASRPRNGQTHVVVHNVFHIRAHAP